MLTLLAVVCIITTAATAHEARAQNSGPTLTLIGVDDSAFPRLTLRLSAVNAAGQPITGLTASSIEILEDNQPAEVISVRDVSDTTQGIAVVLAIDVSESMMGEPLEAARQSAIAFVESLGPNDEVAVLAFATAVQQIQPFTTDKAAATAAIEKLQAGGVTALYDAANQAVLTASAASLPRRAVILLGDGAEYGGASLSSPEDAYEAARASGVTIHTIALGFNADTAYLQKLSGLTGGAALAAPTPDELDTQWQSIAGLMRQLIEVIVKSSVPGDGQTHTLTVRVKVGSSQAEATGTFRSAPVTPTITVSGLAPGEVIDSVTPITADVDAQGTAAAVTFRVDGAVIARDDSPPWMIELDPLTLRSGARELTVEAADDSGTTGSTAISFEVAPLPPSVSLNLQEGQLIESPLSLAPEIKSQNGVKEVVVAVDGKTAAALSEAPYRFALDPANYSGGTHVLAVTVTDASGLSSTAEVGFSVPRAAVPVWIIGLAAVILLAVAMVAFVFARRTPTAAPRPTGARLEVLSGPDRGKVFAVTNERQAIGRMTSAPIHLADPTGALHLSREHARVWQSEGAAFIEDAGSRHGTFANDEQVTAPVRLADGARLKLGEVELVFHGAPVAAEDLRATQFDPAALAQFEVDAPLPETDQEEGRARRTKLKETLPEPPPDESEGGDEARHTKAKPEEESDDDETRRTLKKPE